uniref:Lipid droplet-associated hydrolase n=1 Tax=Plectus sambesii TaxID=2011161 RepID=A0A914WCA6_9BILA
MASVIQRVVQWILVGGRWTRVSVMGFDLPETGIDDSKLSALQEERDIILMIPGNPGNEGFYDHFGRRVLENLSTKRADSKYLFVTVSHLNHVKLPAELERSGGHKRDDRFQLDAQVEHKLEFCRDYLPRSRSIFMLGHSIGSYMMLRILPQLVSDGFLVQKAIALFPTIERMATSPNGLRLTPVLAFFDRYDFLVKLLTWWLDYVPFGVKKWLCSWHMNHPNVPDSVLTAAAELPHLHVFRNIIHLSNDEMVKVAELDQVLISVPEKIMFYYGTIDGWCPLHYGEDMKRLLPVEQVLIDEDKCEHAFVIRDGDVVARKVAEMIF